MARTVQNARLGTRTARLALKLGGEPEWQAIETGLHLGYWRGPRGSRWLARYRDTGAGTKGYRKTTLGQADDHSDADGAAVLTFAQAQERARAWRVSLTCPAAAPDHAKSYTVADALDDYMAGFEGKSRTATLSRVEAIIKPELGQELAAKLTAETVRLWHRQRAQAPARLRTGQTAKALNVRETTGDDAVRRRRSTANRDLTVLKAALNVAVRDGKLRNTAFRDVKPFKSVDGARTRYLTDAEALRLVNAADPAFRPMVQAAMLTGARYGSLAAARVRDFDPQSAVLTFPDTKGGRAHRAFLDAAGVALCKRAAAGKRGDELLFPRPDGNAWGPSQQARFLDAACERGGVERATFHDLRRTYGARLARRGVPMAVIAEALGHADIRMTMKHYAHLAPSYVADTIREHVAGMGLVQPDNLGAIG